MIHFDVNYDTPVLTPSSKASLMLAVEVEKDTRPYVPADTMSLNQRTRIMGNQVVYPAPYARYLYEGKVMVDSITGKGAMKIPEVGYRFHRGATLVATSRDLKFQTAVHPKAQSHWFEASKHDNLEKWERVAAKVLTNGK